MAACRPQEASCRYRAAGERRSPAGVKTYALVRGRPHPSTDWKISLRGKCVWFDNFDEEGKNVYAEADAFQGSGALLPSPTSEVCTLLPLSRNPLAINDMNSFRKTSSMSRLACTPSSHSGCGITRSTTARRRLGRGASLPHATSSASFTVMCTHRSGRWSSGPLIYSPGITAALNLEGRDVRLRYAIRCRARYQGHLERCDGPARMVR